MAPSSIEGKICRLRPFTAADITLKNKWNNDKEVSRYLGLHPPYTLSSTRRWYNKISRDPDSYLFIIETKSKKPIGYLKIECTPRGEKTFCELHILIGDRKSWGKGYGTDAVQAATTHSFLSLRAKKVIAHVRVENTASQGLFEKCGFKKREFLYVKTR